jgi:hypothetical protein
LGLDATACGKTPLFRRSELQLRRNVRPFNGLLAPEETLLAFFRSRVKRRALDFLKDLCLLPPGKGLLRRSDGIDEHDLGQAILVSRIRIGNIGFGFSEFGLAELHDGALSTLLVTS